MVLYFYIVLPTIEIISISFASFQLLIILFSSLFNMIQLTFNVFMIWLFIEQLTAFAIILISLFFTVTDFINSAFFVASFTFVYFLKNFILIWFWDDMRCRIIYWLSISCVHECFVTRFLTEVSVLPLYLEYFLHYFLFASKIFIIKLASLCLCSPKLMNMYFFLYLVLVCVHNIAVNSSYNCINDSSKTLSFVYELLI